MAWLRKRNPNRCRKCRFQNREFKEYKQVLDHYEHVEVTKSRQVVSHYETDYSYVDNGDGTFTEIATERPVYTTEYYTETEQQAVYRDDPVYATKYYYEIDRWYDNREYESSEKTMNLIGTLITY